MLYETTDSRLPEIACRPRSINTKTACEWYVSILFAFTKTKHRNQQNMIQTIFCSRSNSNGSNFVEKIIV